LHARNSGSGRLKLPKQRSSGLLIHPPKNKDSNDRIDQVHLDLRRNLMKRASTKSFKENSEDLMKHKHGSQNSENSKRIRNSLEAEKKPESDNNSRFRELTVKTKWNAAGGSPEMKGNLRNPKDLKLQKGVSFKEQHPQLGSEGDNSVQIKKFKTEPGIKEAVDTTSLGSLNAGVSVPVRLMLELEI
jgi:hypothetical protein